MLLHPAGGALRRHSGLPLGTALIAGILLAPGPVSARPDPCAVDLSARYSCRHETHVPEDAIVSELGMARGTPTPFHSELPEAL